MKPRILIVEDERHIGVPLKFNCEAEGYEATLVEDGRAAIQRIEQDKEAFDLVILDLMLPQMSGYAVLGDRRVSLRRPAAGRAAPVVRVCAHCVLGDIEIVDGEHDAAAGRSVRDW